jgi:acetylornithine deacetylase
VSTSAAPVEDALAQLDSNELVEVLRSLVAVPSVTGDESNVTPLLEGELHESGVDHVEQFEFAAGRHNVWSVRRGVGDGHSVMLLGHIDTVHADGWNERWAGSPAEDPFGAAIIDGDLYGRGAGDQKAGLAISIAAQRAIHRAGLRLRGDVVTLFVGDEESGQPGSGRSEGIQAGVARIKSGEIPSTDFAIYTEPTKLDVYVAQLGFVIGEITVIGRSAFWSTPWLGDDALRGCSALIQRLWRYHDDLSSRPSHRLIGQPSFLITELRAGGQIAVPDRAVIQFIRKLVPGEMTEGVQQEIERVVRAACIEDRVTASTTYTSGRADPYGGQPAETDSSHEGVRLLSRLVEQLASRPDNLRGADYWSELQVLSASCGIPGVYFSAGDISNCHTLEERVSVDELVTAARVMTTFLIEYCGVA